MRLTLSLLFVFCTAASAAVDAAIQSGATLPIASPEGRAIHTGVKENGVYVEAGPVQPQKKGMLTGRKRLLPALGLLVTVVSATALSFLIYNCFFRKAPGKSSGSEKRRLASGGDESPKKRPDVCGIGGLPPYRLKEKAIELAAVAQTDMSEEEQRLKIQGKRLEQASKAHEDLQTALQRRTALPEGSSATEVQTAEEGVHNARAVLATALEEVQISTEGLPSEVGDFEEVRRILERKRVGHRDAVNHLADRRKAWFEVFIKVAEMEDSFTKRDQALAAANGKETDEVQAAQKAVGQAAWELEATVMHAAGLDLAELEEPYSDSDDEEEDEEPSLSDLPVLSAQELQELFSTTVPAAMERLQQRQQTIQQREPSVQAARHAYEALEESMQRYRLREQDDAEKQRLREQLQRALHDFEVVLSRIPGQLEQHYLLPGAERVRGFVTAFCYTRFRDTELDLEIMQAHYNRRRVRWEAVIEAEKVFQKIAAEIQELEKAALPEAQAQLVDLRLKQAEAHLDLHKALVLAEWEDHRPDTPEVAGYYADPQLPDNRVWDDGYEIGEEILVTSGAEGDSQAGDRSESGSEAKDKPADGKSKEGSGYS